MSSLVGSKLIPTRTDFEDCYEFGSEIGKGRYATVKKCYCKKTQKCFAAKVIKNFRTKNSKLNMNIVDNEVTALTLSRSHTSIVNLYEVFQHKGETILILEYATEKDLHIYLDCEGAFEEEKACHIVYQILKAVEFLHTKNILHLDIKPENVLLMTPLSPSLKSNLNSSDTEELKQENLNDLNKSNIKNEPIKVKLCDFSFSQIMTPGKHILGMMGTVAYQAPEVLQYEPLTKATDIWSLGVLTHVLLTEYTPFGNGTEINLQTETNILSVRDKEFKCVEDYFEFTSPEAQDFIESLLKFRPKHRLTVEEALNHKWFKKCGINLIDYESESSCTSSPLTIELINENSTNLEIELKEEIITDQVDGSVIKSSSELITRKVEIKDDKNNNSLSSLVETLELTQLKSEKESHLDTNNENNQNFLQEKNNNSNSNSETDFSKETYYNRQTNLILKSNETSCINSNGKSSHLNNESA